MTLPEADSDDDNGPIWSPDGQYMLFAGLGSQQADVVDLSGQSLGEVPIAQGYGNSGGSLVWTRGPCSDDEDETDGAWEFGGCFAQPDTTDYDGVEPSTLDGLVLDPANGGYVEFSDGADKGDEVTDTGPVDVQFDATKVYESMPTPGGGGMRADALALGQTGKVTINDLPSLDWNLGGAKLTVKSDKVGNLAGFPLTGKVTLAPKSGGTAVATTTSKLPGIFGGGAAKFTVTSTMGRGVTKMTLTAAKADLAGLLPLKNLAITWSAGTWKVSAESLPPGAKSAAKLTGSLTYDQYNQLSAASLHIAGLPLAGLVTLSSLDLSYDASGGWTGQAKLAQAGSAADVGLTFSKSGKLTAGHLHATKVTLFGVLGLKTFDLDADSSGSWKVSVTPNVPHAPTATAALQTAGGAVTGADLEVKDVSLLKKLTLDDLHLNYSVQGGKTHYDGGVSLTLPGPGGGEISGSSELHFADQAFSSGKLDVDGVNVPLGWGAVLHHLGGEIDTNPLKLGGKVGISLGPKTAIGTAADVEGHLAYDFSAKTYTGDGSFTIGGVTLGSGTFQLVTGKSGEVAVALGDGDGSDGLHLGKLAELHGSIKGEATASTLDLTGHADFTIAGHKVADGDVAADTHGIAACSKSGNGFTWKWGQTPQPHFDGHCKLKGY
jgi:hypothetical protein